MNEPHARSLETQLGELTEWRSGEPTLWNRALDAATRRPHRLARRVPTWLGIGAIAVAILIASSVALRFSPDASPRRAAPSSLINAQKQPHIGVTWALNSSDGNPADDDSGVGRPRTLDVGEGRLSANADGSAAPRTPGAAPRSSAPEPDARHVIRKATLELATPDVRAAFLKAQQITSEARGEFIQDSSLAGAGKEAQASLTLRVAADRLSEALNQLRDLVGPGGEVRSENITGEDVTSQAVDLDARLRNEQRVEAELLTLLEKRTDAPLKEILELRDHMSGVRSQIEQLTAQRDRLSRLVSLATILVLIRPSDAPAPAATHDHIGKYFSDSIAAAWSRGLRLLADSVAGAVGLVVGGLVWWLLLLLVLILVRSFLKRKPPPWAVIPAASTVPHQP